MDVDLVHEIDLALYLLFYYYYYWNCPQETFCLRHSQPNTWIWATQHLKYSHDKWSHCSPTYFSCDFPWASHVLTVSACLAHLPMWSLCLFFTCLLFRLAHHINPLEFPQVAQWTCRVWWNLMYIRTPKTSKSVFKLDHELWFIDCAQTNNWYPLHHTTNKYRRFHIGNLIYSQGKKIFP